MPSKPYCVNVTELPRQSRFGGLMEETAVVMDGALLKFSWATPMSGEMTGRAATAESPMSTRSARRSSSSRVTWK